ncbi:MAG: type VI secretion system contractile sheath large subunit [Candidatus Eisenbacteria bacterium]|nr:type VI secretion system contractile sheath large subunit [Candidatus Eisenbacteria bacterium]
MLPWKLLVVADLGLSAAEPQRLSSSSQGLDGWPTRWSGQVEIPLPNERGTMSSKTLSLKLDSFSAFTPSAIMEALRNAGVAAPTAVQIDAVLHHAIFQRVESAWRGLAFLAAHVGADLELFVLSSPRDQLIERFRSEVFLAMQDPWSAIVLDFDWSHKGPELETLRTLAGMAKVLKAPLLTGAAPTLFDLRYFAHLSAIPNVVDRVSDPAHATWREYQTSEEARWVSLSVNRYLQRAPYRDDAEGGHRELVEEAKPETFLFGRASWLVGAAMARSIATHGHALDLAGARGGRFEGLPTRSYPQAINDEVALAAETPLPEMRAMELTRAGVSPVVGILRTNGVVLPLVNTSFQLMPGKLTTEALLPYQITVGRVGQLCDRLLDRVSAGAAPPETSTSEGLCAWIQSELTAFLGPLAGDPPGSTVAVTREEIDPGDGSALSVAHVTITPTETLEGRPFTIELILPLG